MVDGAVVWTRIIGTADNAPVLPDGCMDLLWMGERLVVAGPDTRGHTTAIPAGARVAGIRFRSLTAAVAVSPDPVAALERIAGRRAAETGIGDPALRAVVHRLAAGIPVAATAGEFGLGERTLRRMSLSAFGYGPKMLARFLRLQRALALARSGIPFAETAVRAGYADQAHLARDVRELAGMPLGRLVVRDETDSARSAGSVAPRR